jgi:hypothetical protein
MPKKYCIHLTEAERSELKGLVTAGKAAAPKRLRAQILLAADGDHPGGAMKDAEIVRALGVSICTVERTRCALAEHGLQIAVHGWPPQRKISRLKVDGWTEAHLIAASCAAPPQGRSRWTLKLLGDHVVALGLVDRVSPQTVGRALKKTS